MNTRNLKRWLLGIFCVGVTISAASQTQSTTTELIPYLDANGQYGFADASGKLVIPAQYSSVSRFSEGRAAVAADGKWGYIDESGRWVVKPGYTSAEDYANGQAVARIFVQSNKKGGSGGFISFPNPGDAILPWRHDARSTMYRFDLAGNLLEKRSDGGKRSSAEQDSVQLPTGVVNALKTPAYRHSLAMPPVPPLYPVAAGCAEGVGSAPTSNDCGAIFLDADGQALSTSVYSAYDRIMGFQSDRLRVSRSGKYGFVNSHGVEVIACTYDLAQAFEGGYAVVSKRGWGLGVIDPQGRQVVDFAQGDLAYNDLRYPAGGYFIGHRKSGWGVLDAIHHREVVPFTHADYDDVKILHEGSSRLALAVRDEAKGWCLLDMQGSTLRCGYTQVWGAHENVIAVKDSNGHWGAVDPDGQIIFPPRYDNLFTFEKGLALVRRGQYAFYVDAHGKEYISPSMVAPD